MQLTGYMYAPTPDLSALLVLPLVPSRPSGCHSLLGYLLSGDHPLARSIALGMVLPFSPSHVAPLNNASSSRRPFKARWKMDRWRLQAIPIRP